MGKRGPLKGSQYKSKPGPVMMNLDQQEIERLAQIQCTMQEIAHVMNCSVDTLENRYMDIIQKGKAKGRMSVRRMQFKLLSEGNATMGVWLGKQLLGQKDRSDLNVNLADDFINAIGDL